MRWRVTVYTLADPPRPAFYRDFPKRGAAREWRTWALETPPCTAKTALRAPQPRKESIG